MAQLLRKTESNYLKAPGNDTSVLYWKNQTSCYILWHFVFSTAFSLFGLRSQILLASKIMSTVADCCWDGVTSLEYMPWQRCSTLRLLLNPSPSANDPRDRPLIVPNNQTGIRCIVEFVPPIPRSRDQCTGI